MTAALDFVYPASPRTPSEVSTTIRPPLRLVPSDHIPLLATRPLMVSLTQGCDAPLDALRALPDCAVSCHPCDEAVVMLLLLRTRRGALALLTCPDVDPGTLRLD